MNLPRIHTLSPNGYFGNYCDIRHSEKQATSILYENYITYINAVVIAVNKKVQTINTYTHDNNVDNNNNKI